MWNPPDPLHALHLFQVRHYVFNLYNNGGMLLNILRNLLLFFWVPIAFTLWAPIGVLWGLLSPPFRHKLHKISQHWCRWAILPALGVKLKVLNNPPRLSGPCICMCNHQSYLDILILMACLRGNFSFIVKKELRWFPFLGWYIAGAGHIFIEREDSLSAHGALSDALHHLQNGEQVVIFPEGTRSRDGNLLPLKRGGFILAIEAGVPIIPIRIRGTSDILPRGTVWTKPGEVSIRFGEPIDPQKVAGSKKERQLKLMELVRQRISEF